MLLYIESNGLYIGLLLGGVITLTIITITLKAVQGPRWDHQKIPVQKSHQTYDSGYYKSNNNSRYDNRGGRGSSDAVMGIVFFIGLTWVTVTVVPENSTKPHGDNREEPVSIAYTYGDAPSNPMSSAGNSTTYPANIQDENVENDRPQPVFVSHTDNSANFNYVAVAEADEREEKSQETAESYFIQIGAFSAREIAASVANKWFNVLSTSADVVIANENDGIYKVWIGTFDEATEAREFKRYAGLPKDALIKNGEGATLSFEF